MTMRIRRSAVWLAALAVLGSLVAVTGFMTAAADARTTVAPRNLTPPTISGTQRQGARLTTTNGTWENNPTSFQYKWQRCNTEGTGCTDIAGARDNTYVLTAADVDRTIRSEVTAANADGATATPSAPTGIISANTPPRNTVRPSISGTPQVGEELTASNGTWTGGVRSFAYQWQRCDDAGANCVAVAGAGGRTYGIRAADEGRTLRVEVTATNLAGSASATSDRTNVVRAAAGQPPPPPPPGVNERPRITLLSARFVGRRVHARVRICDDSMRNVIIFERDSKAGQRPVTRRFSTATPPRPCGVYTRSWTPGARFLRPGRYVVTLWARDAFGRTSTQVRKTFFR